MKISSILATCLAAILSGCSGEATKIPISMDLTDVSNTDDISRFIFVVKDPSDSTSESLLFPSSCTGCASDTSPCPAADVCVKLDGCGFEVSENAFDARVDFSDFPGGSNIELVACATDGQSAIVAGGSTQFVNRTGETIEVSLDDVPPNNDCDVLPDPCP